jgi:hypothetical protein
MKPGDEMVFTKSGNAVRLLELRGKLWGVERVDTGKGMSCPPGALVTRAEWARMVGE